ncbi:MAG: SAM-dependent methyltransferase [Betaproteobacteria bacterium RIFCSPLOWO2_02_FULL_67_26]|nr:MAG: SAM-dependent methyltransferase [Betaproteobacteria bacterium RIFCSPLOWO2_02_FULL_67_26]
MRPTAASLEAAATASALACRLVQPADAVLREFFRSHHELGSHDRALVAETVFAVLRHKRLLEALVPDPTPRRLALASLVKFGGISIAALNSLLERDDHEWLIAVKRAATETLPAAVQLSLPDWIWERLAGEHAEQEAVSLARSLLNAAPLDLRVNTLRGNRDEVLRTFAADGIAAEPTPYSPVGVRLTGRPAINRHSLFTTGAVEVQDESSQLACYLVAPKRHEMVVDFCAGAGGKSLMLGALMRSQGRIYAFDVSAARLARFKPRLKRSGLSNLYPHPIANENDLRVKRLGGKIDRVLVDAPCTGLGTLRRNPDLKWRQSPQSLAELKLKQAAILRAASNLLKPGGRLVYATCSLLAAENEDIVAAFIADRGDFRKLHCGELLAQQGIALDTGECLRLAPHVHGTDGFFAAAMTRS